MGIQIPNKPREKDVLDKLEQGFGIAQRALGIGLAIPEFLQKRDKDRADEAYRRGQEQRSQDTYDLTVKKTLLDTRPATKEEIEAGEAVEIDGRMVVKDDAQTTSALSFRNQGLLNAIKGKVPFVYDKGSNDVLQLPTDEINEKDHRVLTPENYDIYANKVAKLRRDDLSRIIALLGDEKQDRKTLKKEIADGVKPFNIELQGVRTIRKMLASGNSIAENLALTRGARVIGKEVGNLAEGDIKRMFPQALSSDVQGVLNYFSGAPYGKLTPEAKKLLNKMVDISELDILENRAEEVQNIIEDNEDSVGPKGRRLFDRQKNTAIKRYGLDILKDIDEWGNSLEFSEEEKKEAILLLQSTFRGLR